MTLQELLDHILRGEQRDPGGPPRRTVLGTMFLSPGLGLDDVYDGALAGGREAMLRGQAMLRGEPPNSRMGAMVGGLAALNDTARPFLPPEPYQGPMGPGGVTGEPPPPWAQGPPALRVRPGQGPMPPIDMSALPGGGPVGHVAFEPASADAPMPAGRLYMGMPADDGLDAAWAAARERAAMRMDKDRPQYLADMNQAVERARVYALARRYVADDVRRQRSRAIPLQPAYTPMMGPGGIAPAEDGGVASYAHARR